MGKASETVKVLSRYHGREFAYGIHDCCTFARDMMEAYHQITIEYPCKYDGSTASIKNNWRAVKARSLREFLTAVARINGWESVGNSFVQPFDLVVVKEGRKVIAGVFDGSRVICVGAKGIVFLPKSRIDEAWGPR